MTIPLVFLWTDPGEDTGETSFPWGEQSKSKKHNFIMYSIFTDLQSIAANTVHSLNNLTGGSVELIEGDNITIDVLPETKQIQIAASGGGGSNPHLHTSMGFDLRVLTQGSKRGCTIWDGDLIVTGYDQGAGANKITRFSTTDLSVITTIDCGSSYPWGLTQDGNFVYEADNSYRNRITKYDPIDWSYTTINLGTTLSGYTYGIEWDPGLGVFWLTDDDGYIYQFPSDLTQPYNFQESLYEGYYPAPSAIAYDPDNIFLWISYIWNYNSHKLLAIKPADRLPVVALPNMGDWMGFAYHSGRFYGVCQGANNTFWVFKGKLIKSVI
jgi:hypothetical protein